MELKDYQILEILGQGSFGIVHKIKRITDGKIFAIKKINFKNIAPKDQKSALNEVRLLASLKNDHIIGFQTAFFDHNDQVLSIIMEFAENGDLSKKILSCKQNNTSIQQNQIWKVMYHIAKALKCLHTSNIIHRDLKAANVFQTKQNYYKLADFNISKIIKQQEFGLAKTQTGTPFYACPQIWQNHQYDTKSDIWSLGIIIYELAALNLPFPARDFAELYQKIQKGKYDRIPNTYSDQLFTIITEMLNPQPKNRPTAEQLIAKCVFNNIRINKNIPLRIISKKNVLLSTIQFPKDLKNLHVCNPKQKIKQENNIFQLNYTEQNIKDKQNYEIIEREKIKSMINENNNPNRREKTFSIREKNIKHKNKQLIVQQDSVIFNISKVSINSNITERNIQGKVRPSKLPSFQTNLRN